MFTRRIAAGPRRYWVPTALPLAVLAALATSGAWAQQSPELAAVVDAPRTSGVHFHVAEASQRLDMIVNSSRILTLDHNVPRILVNNTDVLRATPLSPNQIQISALKPGVTEVNVWDENERVYSIDVRVFGDARELQALLDLQFPSATLRVQPSNSSVIISGYVSSPEDVSKITAVAEDFYPKVINLMTVGGVQQVLLHVKVMEVSRTKLREFGVDWAVLTGNDFIIQSVSGLVAASATQAGILTGAGDTIRFGILDNGNTFGALVDVLRRNNLAKLLAEPTLVTVSGRPASFTVGGEVPVPVPAGLGVTAIEFREFGTQVDFVPIVLDNGNIKLEIRPQVTEVDNTLAINDTPGFRVRRVDTGVEMKAGQTLALAGLVFNKVEAENKGVPWLADLPWAGAAFRRVEHRVNEVELLILVTPEFVSALDPHEVPPCGPGQTSGDPDDVELYWRGYMEVPKCCPDGSCEACRMRTMSGGYEEVPHGVQGDEAMIRMPTTQSWRSDWRNGGGIQSSQQGTSYGTSAPRTQGYATSPATSQSVQPQRTAPVGSSYSGQSRQTMPDRAVAPRRPSLIGPIGYDDL